MLYQNVNDTSVGKFSSDCFWLMKNNGHKFSNYFFSMITEVWVYTVQTVHITYTAAAYEHDDENYGHTMNVINLITDNTLS